MYKWDQKNKTYTYGDNIESVVAATQIRQLMGGKKRLFENLPLSKSTQNSTKKRNLEILGDTPARLIKTYPIVNRSCIEIEQDLVNRYGHKKLKEARYRAFIHLKEIS